MFLKKGLVQACKCSNACSRPEFFGLYSGRFATALLRQGTPARSGDLYFFLFSYANVCDITADHTAAEGAEERQSRSVAHEPAQQSRTRSLRQRRLSGKLRRRVDQGPVAVLPTEARARSDVWLRHLQGRVQRTLYPVRIFRFEDRHGLRRSGLDSADAHVRFHLDSSSLLASEGVQRQPARFEHRGDTRRVPESLSRCHRQLQFQPGSGRQARHSHGRLLRPGCRVRAAGLSHEAAVL